MSVTRSEVLRLYKNLLLYSKKLTLSDPAYFKKRIITEFKRNKDLTQPNDVEFAYKVKHCCIEALWYNMLVLNGFCRLQVNTPFRLLTALKHTIDYSKVPKIHESDLSESFVRGSGPGGSAVNKNANCVVLTHLPTGLVIKCHTSRCQDDNRKMARELLVAKLDEITNGPDSVTAQRKRVEENKYKKTEYKKRKKASLKNEWKKREGLE